jgi:hypothetical protein
MRRWATEIWAACALCFIALTLLAQRPVASVADAPASGPMVVKGRLVGPEGRRAPSGGPAIGWRSWVHMTLPGEGGDEQDSCVRQELTGLRVSDGVRSLRIAQGVFGSGERPSRERGLPDAVPLGDIADPPESTMVRPEERHRSCGGSGGPGERQIYDYREQRLKEGIEVFVSGCRVGMELVACGDGHDQVSTRPVKLGVDIKAWGNEDRRFAFLFLVVLGLVALAVDPDLHARGGEGAQRASKVSGPYRSPTRSPAPAHEDQRIAMHVRVAVGASLSVVVVGPLLGAVILTVGDRKIHWHSPVLHVGTVVALVAMMRCLWLWWSAPPRERRWLGFAMLAAVLGGVASYPMTYVLGAILSLFAHPLGGYHR